MNTEYDSKMKGGPAQWDWETEANARGDASERRMHLGTYLSGVKLIPLVDALTKAEVPSADDISTICNAQAKKKRSDEAESLSYVYAYTFDFGDKKKGDKE